MGSYGGWSSNIHPLSTSVVLHTPFLFEENQRLGQSKWKLDKVLKGIEVPRVELR